MRCPANTHRPSFHVNTTFRIAAQRSQFTRRGGGVMTHVNIDETMTEEEFFEWLRNAIQSGVFEASGGSSNESPSSKSAGA